MYRTLFQDFVYNSFQMGKTECKYITGVISGVLALHKITGATIYNEISIGIINGRKSRFLSV